MKYAIVASTWASLSRTVAAAAIGTWLAFAACPTLFAADGPQAAAAAKEAAKAFSDYAADVARLGDHPDYSRPPLAEYFRRVFDAETLAALPPPEPDDLGWVADWAESAESSFKTLAMFGIPKGNEINAAIARNISADESEIAAAIAFVMRLSGRLVSTTAIFATPPGGKLTEEIRKKILDRAARGLAASRGLVQTVLTTTQIMSSHLKPQNAMLMMVAVRDTLDAWAPYTSADERKIILNQLEQARAANADAGIDDDVTAISAAISSGSSP